MRQILILAAIGVAASKCGRTGAIIPGSDATDAAGLGDGLADTGGDRGDTAGPAADASAAPALRSLTPLPLASDGPAFWMEGQALEDGTLEVRVLARGLLDLVGFAAWITWDPTLLDLVDVAATAPIGDPAAVARSVAAPLGPGRATLGVVRFPKEPDPWDPKPSGLDLPGVAEAGRLVLRPLAPGDTTVGFVSGHSLARRPDRSEIPCAWAGLRVRIGGAP